MKALVIYQVLPEHLKVFLLEIDPVLQSNLERAENKYVNADSFEGEKALSEWISYFPTKYEANLIYDSESKDTKLLNPAALQIPDGFKVYVTGFVL